MRNILKNIFCASLAGLILAGCSKEESDFAGTDNHIISFEMKVGSESYKAVILDNEIRLTVPKSTDLSQGKPDIVLCENMRLTPDPSTITDWGEEYQFIATSYNNSDRIYRYRIIHPEVSTDGNVVLNTQADVDAFARSGIDVIRGNLIIGAEKGGPAFDSIRNLEGLENLLEVEYNVIVNETFAGETLNLKSLRSMYGLTRTTDDRGNNIICKNLKNIVLPSLTEVVSGITIRQPHIQRIEMPALVRVGGNMTVNTDELNAIDLTSLETVRGDLSFTSGRNGTKLETFSLPALKELGGTLSLSDIPQMTAVDLPDLASAGGFSMTGCVKISNLTNTILENLTGELTLSGNNSLSEVQFPTLKKAGSVNILDGTVGFVDFTALAEVGILDLQTLTIMNLDGFKSLKTAAKISLTNMELVESFDGMESLQSVGELILDRIPISGELDLTNLQVTSKLQLTGSTLNVPKIVGPEVLECDVTMDGTNYFGVTKMPLFEGIKQIGSLNLQFTTMGIEVADLGNLTRITGLLRIYTNHQYFRKVNAQNLVSIGGLTFGGLYTSKAEDVRTFNFPLLETITGDASINLDIKGIFPDGFSVPALTSIGGSIEIEVSTQTGPGSLDFSALTTVGGKLSIINRNLGASTGISSWNFDNLESAGSVYISRIGMTDFSTFKKVIPSLNETTWETRQGVYDPTYQDMLDGKYTPEGNN